MIRNIMLPSVNSKIRGMYSNGLTKEDYEDLIKQTQIKDVIVLLKNKNKELEDLSIDSTRVQIEEVLDRTIITNIKKVELVLKGKNQELFDLFILKYAIKCAKIKWKMLETMDETKSSYIENWVGSIFPNLKKLYEAKTKEEFINNIYHKKIKMIFENNDDLFQIENKLDKFYFETLYNEAYKYSKETADLVDEITDLFNFEWMYRIKRYYGITDENNLVSNKYKINKFDFKKISEAKDVSEINEVLSHTIYKDIFVGEDVYTNIKKYLMKRYKKLMRRNIFDIASIISYFSIKEIENENIINIIEGIRYKISAEEIQKKIVI